MNRKSLEKIKEALLKESPNIEYALGILDTLMDSLPEDRLSIPVSNGLNGIKFDPAFTERADAVVELSDLPPPPANMQAIINKGISHE